jgi:hypothetical protein
MALAIAFVGSLLPGCGPRKAPASAERAIHVSEPPNRKAIDAGLLDDDFLVSLAEDLSVDQPRCPTAAHRTFDDAHELTSMKEKGCGKLATLWLSTIQLSVSGGGDPRLTGVDFLHLLDQLRQDSEVGDLVDRLHLEAIENVVELCLWDLRRDRADLR